MHYFLLQLLLPLIRLSTAASGGNGGHGGNVYIKPVPHYSSLSHIKKTMLAHNGQAGAGTWLHGRRGNDLTIEVPYGTVVREIRQAQLGSQDQDDPDHQYHEGNEGEEEESLDETWSAWRKRLTKEKLTDPEKTKERRAKMFVLYPTMDEDIELLDNKIIDELEFSFLEEERREKLNRFNKPPVEIDFDERPSLSENENLEMEGMPASADKIPPKQDDKILLLRGGRGGFGNPYFTKPNSRRSPKLATRGRLGESMRIELELKTLADIGLVGFPNAGKRCLYHTMLFSRHAKSMLIMQVISLDSTVLQALTYSRSTIAPYAFTTMTPQIGTLIIYDDATYSTTTSTSLIEETASRSSLPTGSNRTRLPRPADKDARQERLRLTIADCPGLLPNAADNVGLGHDFLRHIERSKVLVYVVDLSGKDPVKDLLVLKQELEDYKPGLSERARIIVANKADKVDENDEASVQAMKEKLDAIRDLARQWQEVDDEERVVIPMSARMRGNVDAFVNTMVAVLEESK